MPLSITKFGNTNSVSIPLMICSELSDIDVDNALIVGMGAGLSTGVGDIGLHNVLNI